MDTQARKIDFLQAILKTIAIISLSLWIGGLVAIGALVAPQAFHVFRTDPAFAGNLNLQNQLAADIIGGSFRKFNKLCEVSGVILTLSLIGLTLNKSFNKLQKRLGWSSSILTAALTASALYLDFMVFPAMDAAKAIGNNAQFDQLHVLYVQLSNVQLIGLLIVVVGLSLMSSL